MFNLSPGHHRGRDRSVDQYSQMSITPDFRLFHVSDGTSVAEAIAKKFSGDRYNLRVELYDLQRRSSSLCGSFSSSASSSSASSTSARSSHTKAHLSVLLVTPGMIKHWNGAGNDGRSSFVQYLGTNTKPVAVSCFVPRNFVEAQIEVVFPQSSLEWRHLEVGLSSSSFNQCVIGLISLLEEEHEPMPMPMLKKCHLLPKKSVMAGDAMYIQLEDDLPEFMDSSSLSVVFDHDMQISANRIGNCLYEFHLPECSQLTSTLVIYTSNGECLGTEEITYKDRGQLLSTILSDLLNPVEFMSQALQLNQVSPEMIDAKLAFWFRYKDGDTARTESQRIMNQWVKVIKCTKGSVTSSCQELPTLLHLSAKYNLSLLAESLLTHPWAALALKMQNKDGLRPDQLALKYHHNSLSEFLAAENEADNSSSCDDEDIYVHPDYCTPGGLLTPNEGDAIFYFDFDFDTRRFRKNSSSSSKDENNSNSSKPSPTCPPVCTPRRKPPPVPYVNTSPHSSQRPCSKNAAETSLTEKPVPMLSKATIHGRHHSLDSADTQGKEGSTRSFESVVQQPRPKPRQSVSDKVTKSSRSSGESSAGRPATPPRPPQPLKVFVSPESNQNDPPKCTVVSHQSSGDYILMQRLRPNFLMPHPRVRRSSVSLTLQQSHSQKASPLKSSLSLSGLNEREDEMSFTLTTRRAAKDLAMSPKAPTFLGTITPSHYASKPRRSLPQSPLASPASPSPPPLPATPPPRHANLPPISYPQQPLNSNHKQTGQSNPMGYSQGPAHPQPHVVYLTKRCPSSRKFADLGEATGGHDDLSPDFSQPIDVHFDDVPTARALPCDYITPIDDEESIYEDLDSRWEMAHEGDVSFIRAKSTRGRQSFRKVIVVEKSTLEDPPSLATSLTTPSSPTSPKSPLSPHFFPLTKSLSTMSLSSHESQPKSPSLFATLTSKFSSKKKQSKATKEQATNIQGRDAMQSN